jgi:hypothetical protein
VPRQVSWLTGHRLPSVFPELGGSSDDDGLRLAAYSCGGSAGIGLTAAPASLLALDFAIRETVTTTCSTYTRIRVNESLTGYTRFRAWPRQASLSPALVGFAPFHRSDEPWAHSRANGAAAAWRVGRRNWKSNGWATDAIRPPARYRLRRCDVAITGERSGPDGARPRARPTDARRWRKRPG